MISAPPAVTLREVLQQYCVRAGRVLFVRYAVNTCCLAVIGIGAAAASSMSGGRLVWVVPGAIVAALVTAAFAAARHRPNLHGTATALDARCGMDDCVVTALQFADHDDPVSRLVVSQANRRLNGLTPAAAFPYQWQGHSRVLLATAAAALVIVGGTLVNPARWPGTRIITGGPQLPASSATDGGSAAEPNAPLAQMTAAQARGGGPPVGAARMAGPGQAPRPDGSSFTVTTPSAGTGSSSTPSDPLATQAADPFERSRPKSGESANSAAGQADQTVTAGTSRGATGRGTGSAGDATRGTAVPQRGGVTASPTAGGAAPRGQFPAGYAARYHSAVGRLEEALAREQIPGELRDTVRIYFTAIRP